MREIEEELGVWERSRRKGRREWEEEVQLTAAVESHSSCACEAMIVGTALFDDLLGEDIAGCEKDLFRRVRLITIDRL